MLVDAGTIEGYLDVDAALAARVAKHVRKASHYLRSLKGDLWYYGVLVLPATDATRQRAEEAEALLCYYYALPLLNLRVDAGGGVLTQEWTDDGGGVKVQKVFAGARALEAVRADLLSQAKLLISGDVRVTTEGGQSNVISSVGEISPASGLTLSALVPDEAPAGDADEGAGSAGEGEPPTEAEAWAMAVPDAALRARLEAVHGITSLTLLAEYASALHLAGSELADVTGLGYAVRATSLLLGGNLLTAVPAELGQLSALRTLRLEGNALSGEIPEALATLANLEVLHLESNSFSEADLSAFVAALWEQRAQLGANTCEIDLRFNGGLSADAVARIEGTGAYAGDGLVQAGCTVQY